MAYKASLRLSVRQSVVGSLALCPFFLVPFFLSFVSVCVSGMCVWICVCMCVCECRCVCVCVFSFLFCRFSFSSRTGTLGPPTKDFTEECSEGEHGAVVCGSMAGREQQQQQLAGLALVVPALRRRRRRSCWWPPLLLLPLLFVALSLSLFIYTAKICIEK